MASEGERGAAEVLDLRDEAGHGAPSHRQWTPLARALTIMGDKWTLMIAMELADGRTRLSELRSRLAGVSAGVLDRYLHRMEEGGLITRARFKEMPPRVELELTESGRELLPVATAVARWGQRFAWSGLREGEQLDVAALLRQQAAALEQPLQLERTDPFVLAVRERRSMTRTLLEVRDGRLRGVRPASGKRAAVTISGDQLAWARALGPERDRSELELSGERGLGEALLDALGDRPYTPAGEPS